MKKWVLLLLLLLLLPPAALAEQEEGQVYIIRKGDTLWGISQRFLKDPHYWPSLWSNNPAITNPHLIQPGREVRIYGGRIEFVPVRPEAVPTVAAETAPAPAAESGATVEAAPPAPPVEEVVTIRVPGKIEGFISSEEIDAAGAVVDATDGRIMLATGDSVFVEMANLAAVNPGDRYIVLRVGNEVLHPVTGARIGFRVLDLGNLTIAAVHSKVATGLITSASREIERGDRLVPWQPPVQEVALKQASQPLTGFLVDGGSGQIAVAQYNLIYVDLGAADGIEPGNMLYISRPRRATDLAGRQELELPDLLLGSAVVLDVRPETAAALVLKSTGPLLRGDRVTAATE